MVVLLFKTLVYAHVVTGTVGLITLWVPIAARKGTRRHVDWGKVFYWSLLATGTIAVGISTVTLAAPLETHPFWDDAAMVRGVFGWMMLYLAVLTINLTHYGRLCVQNKRQHAANRTFWNFAGQAAMFAAAVNCAIQGLLLEQYLLVGMSSIGIVAGVLNTHFIVRESPPLNEWLIQHSRGLVGAGISVYTAFLAFGAVNLLPAFAFNPILWATPCTLGIAYLLYHQVKIMLARRPKNPVSGAGVTT
ncbi:MAG: hypothetical protein AAGH76_00620 [Pseudomonadota bacterium]